MTIMQLLTPVNRVASMSATDTVRDAFDHLARHDVDAAPIVDQTGRYVDTVTEADLRRHVASSKNRIIAFTDAVSAVEHRVRNAPVRVEQPLATILDRAAVHGFVPVVDASGKLLGIVERRALVDRLLPTAA